MHRRQFFVGPSPVRVHGDWKQERLDCGRVLSHCPSLPVLRRRARDEKLWVLLGRAVETDRDRPDPAEQLRNAAAEDVPSLTTTWSGRWVLIGDGRFWADACGLLSCFFRRGRDGGAAVAASSPSLLSEVTGCPPDPRRRSLAFRGPMNWYPLPRSRYRGIRHLLPSQSLDLVDGSLEATSLLGAVERDLAYEEALSEIRRRLVTFMRRMPVPGRTNWIALSAGVDSRTLLAACVDADVPVRTFTYSLADLSVADGLLPPKLAAAVGVSHRWIGRRRRPSGDRELFDRHTGHSVADRVVDYHMDRQLSFTDPSEIYLHGGGFEAARGYYHTRLPPTPPREAADLCEHFGVDPHSTSGKGLAEWLHWVREHPAAHLDWRDRFYLEQRLAGWRAAGELAMDLGVDRLHPCNSRGLLALLLSLDASRRVEGRHQLDLISRMEPRLSDLPVNPPEDEFGRLTRARVRTRHDRLYPLRWLWRRLRAAGPVRAARRCSTGPRRGTARRDR